MMLMATFSPACGKANTLVAGIIDQEFYPHSFRSMSVTDDALVANAKRQFGWCSRFSVNSSQLENGL
jgi:hypothetical protein